MTLPSDSLACWLFSVYLWGGGCWNGIMRCLQQHCQWFTEEKLAVCGEDSLGASEEAFPGFSSQQRALPMDTACQGNMDEKDMEDLALGIWEFHGEIGPVCISNCYNLQHTSSVTFH